MSEIVIGTIMMPDKSRNGFWNRIQYYFLKKRIAELEDENVSN